MNWRSYSLDQQDGVSTTKNGFPSSLTPASTRHNGGVSALNNLQALAPSLPVLENLNNGRLDFVSTSGTTTPRQPVRRELTQESSFSSEYEPSPERHTQAQASTQHQSRSDHKRGKSLNILNGFLGHSNTHENGSKDANEKQDANTHSRNVLRKHRPHASQSHYKEPASNTVDHESQNHNRGQQASHNISNHIHNKKSDQNVKQRPHRPVVHIPSSSDDDDDVPLALLQQKGLATQLSEDTPLAYFDTSKHVSKNDDKTHGQSHTRYHTKSSKTKTPNHNDNHYTDSTEEPKKLVNLTEDDYYYANAGSRRPRGQGYTPSSDSPGPLISHATQPYGTLPELALLSAAIPTRLAQNSSNDNIKQRSQRYHNQHTSPQQTNQQQQDNDATSPYTADSLLANLPVSKSMKTGLNKGIIGQDGKKTLMDMQCTSRYVPGSLLEQQERVNGGPGMYRKIIERA